ncbi:MAG: 50S ribosome-binding GTPase [Bacteriovoracaceae bacterium]|nr:50S ribosome-binding GTPase [Bacteriovoracaceae bacterium]
MKFLSNDPIITCSTNIEKPCALAVIRLSGFEDLSNLQQAFSLDLNSVEPKKVYFSKILGKENILDEGLITFFKAPESYNGENILELSVHGNPLSVSSIINRFTHDFSFREAQGGEFTYRALRNNKMSLSQVEGLDLLLHATSSLTLNQGQSLLRGELHSLYKKVHESFLKVKTALELHIDFADDVGEHTAQKYLQEAILDFSNIIQFLYKKTKGDVAQILSPEIILMGETNAGKSSLFNAFLSHDRAIVSPQAGTTRDYISEAYFIEGVKFTLIDTAGIRKAEDSIEQAGIKKGQEKTTHAFFKILVINPFLSQDDLILENPDLVIFTHKDQKAFAEKRKFFSPTVPTIDMDLTTCSLSDLAKVEEFILNKYKNLNKDEPILLGRHKKVIEDIFKDWSSFTDLHKRESDVAILSSELQIISQNIYALVGVINAEDVLTEVFSRFCIGK